MNDYFAVMLWLLLTICLLLPYTVLLLLYRYWWQQVPTSTISPNFIPQTHFTILIPARNEAKQIGACLASLQQLNYPAHLVEIIVIDDFSEDQTAAIVQQVQGVTLISLANHVKDPINSYKKKAIEIGIANAKGNFIVTTDADCLIPPNWLAQFAAIIEQKPTAFIAAPVVIHAENSWIQIFQSLDFLSLQGITGASVGAGFHSMCNGANLCYSKTAFEQVNGFQGVDQIASGDDMLLMHKLYKQFPEQVHYCKASESIVETAAVQTMGDFFRQRIRWASKARTYQDKSIMAVLVLVYLLNFWLFSLAVVGFFNHSAWIILAAALFIKTIFELIFLIPVAAFYRKEALLIWFPMAQVFHIMYTVVAGWLGQMGQYQWKGRTVR